jgi:hypothetical protein
MRTKQMMGTENFMGKYETLMPAIIVLLSTIANESDKADIRNEVEVIKDQFERGLITADEAVGKMNDVIGFYARWVVAHERAMNRNR